jgi:hypothetical protein
LRRPRIKGIEEIVKGQVPITARHLRQKFSRTLPVVLLERVPRQATRISSRSVETLSPIFSTA